MLTVLSGGGRGAIPRVVGGDDTVSPPPATQAWLRLSDATDRCRAMLFQALLMATKEQFESGVARALGAQQ